MTTLCQVGFLAGVGGLVMTAVSSRDQMSSKRSVGISAIAAGVAAGGFTLALIKLFEPARHPFKQLEPIRNKSLIKRLFLGHLADVTEDIWEGFAGPRFVGDQKHTKFCSFGLGMARLYTCNAEDLQHVFTANDTMYQKGRGYMVIRRVLGDGLVTILGDEMHTKHRRIVGPAFSPKALNVIAEKCIPLQVAAFLRTVKTLSSSHPTKEVPLQKLFNRLTLDIITEAAFKIGPNDEKLKDAIQSDFEGAMTVFSPARLSKVVETLQVGVNLRCEAARDEIHRKVEGIVAKIQNDLGGEAKIRDSSADSLIDYLVHSGLSKKEIADHSTTFLFAGSDTTSGGLTFLTYLLAKNPHVQAKLLEEVESCIGLGQVGSLDDVKRCSYLKNCVRECLRLFSPAVCPNRVAMRDDVLPGTRTFVPKGTILLLSIVGMQRDPLLWGEDSNDFVPERWDAPGVEEKALGLGDTSALSYMPFLVGKRNCIGKDLAMNELLMITAALVRNFELRWPEGQADVKPSMNVTIKTVDPFNLVVIPRTE